MLCLVLASVWCVASAWGQGRNPTCGGAFHYRWAQKTDTTLTTRPPIAVELDTIVTSWAEPSLPAVDWCAPREGNERKTYSVVGWVRVFRLQADSDWHVELTATPTAPIGSCMIAEFPPIRYGAILASARRQLAQALSS